MVLKFVISLSRCLDLAVVALQRYGPKEGRLLSPAWLCGARRCPGALCLRFADTANANMENDPLVGQRGKKKCCLPK